MNFDEFYNKFIQATKVIGKFDKYEENQKLYAFMNMLIEYNKRINLTSIIEPEEIIVKHFADSLSINKYIEKNENIVDIGTGAGFPGIPISIYREDCKITMVDSTKKKINFVNEVIKNLKIENARTMAKRAEEIGQMEEYREKFNIAVSRAVAPINVLLEYLLPLVKVGGRCICMKGPNVNQELDSIQGLCEKLGGEYEGTEQIFLNNEELERNIVLIKKINKTKAIYPRKNGIPSKKPLG